MENGYAFVPPSPPASIAALKGMVGVEPHMRVVLPLSGNTFGAYVAIDDSGGADLPTALGQLAVTFNATVFLGTAPRASSRAQMPTRLEPPAGILGFILLACSTSDLPVITPQIADLDVVIGLAEAGSGWSLLVELAAADLAEAEKAYQDVLSVAGASVLNSAVGYGRVSDGAWRDR